MAAFDPVTALLGGALIGAAAVMLMLLTGRIAGISGIFSGILTADSGGDRSWRVAFIAGLIAAPLLAGLFGYPLPLPDMPGWPLVIAGGLLVGFGTRMAGGCTSGHGICGMARFSARSVVATMIFMAAAVATVAVMRHVIGA